MRKKSNPEVITPQYALRRNHSILDGLPGRARRLAALLIVLFCAYSVFLLAKALTARDVPYPGIPRVQVRWDQLAAVLDLYRHHAGRYPSSLQDLGEAPADPTLVAQWKGPYVADHNELTDCWGQPLRYLAPGMRNPGHYDLWSVGADGEDGTDDDVGNW